MSSADLKYVRALLVAQTAEVDPQAKSLFGRLFPTRSEPSRPASRPLLLGTVPSSATPVQTGIRAEAGRDTQRRSDGVRPPAHATPPPSPASSVGLRAEFGRRPDLSPEPELVLDKPAAAARRLQWLDPAGKPVGEMVLPPDAPPVRMFASLVREEVPFFPEDFLDPEQPAEPQPLRPWLKALRRSGRARSAGADQTASLPDYDKPLCKQVRERRARTRRAPTLAAPRPLGHDLLEALCVTLAREQETLADRLLSVAIDPGSSRSEAEASAA